MQPVAPTDNISDAMIRGQLQHIITHSGVADDLVQVETTMLARLASSQPALREAGIYTVKAGGKRLRALLVLLAARIGDYDFTRAVHPAVAIELLHAASLVHDDVIDHASSRRGRATVHMTWSRDVALALGDFLFGELAGEPDPRIIGFYVHAAQRMIEGELNPVTLVEPMAEAEHQYYRKIGYKTAVLFEAACKSGIAVCGGSQEAVAALGVFGYQLGLAFQIVDDILDMVESSEILGKPAGNDLREGTITLPLILAAAVSDAPMLRLPAAGPVDASLVPTIIDAIQVAGGIELAYAAAQQCVQTGLAAVAPFAAPDVFASLESIAHVVLHRRA
jgi:heptaprenyl diphosphate synthase